MKIAHTRAMIHAALSGALDTATFHTDPIFNLAVPTAVPGVPAAVLTPRDTWADRPPTTTRRRASSPACSSRTSATSNDRSDRKSRPPGRKA